MSVWPPFLIPNKSESDPDGSKPSLISDALEIRFRWFELKMRQSGSNSGQTVFNASDLHLISFRLNFCTDSR